MDERDWKPETICQHTGEDYSYDGAVVPPIFQNSLFVQDDCETFVNRGEDRSKQDYTRISNPTTEVAEKKIAALEKTEAARVFSSGMGAIAATIMSCVSAGKHVVCTTSAYGPTLVFLRDFLAKFGVETTFVDGRNTDEVISAIRDNTTLIYMESPGTFYFHIQDIRAICAVAKERGIATALDNSWASPIFQNPAEMGVDLVCHTATKYLGGHSDIVSGVVCGSHSRLDSIREQERALLGSNADPFAAWLLLRSLRTLPIRMERHQKSGLAVANFLNEHPCVKQVYHPSLPAHEGYELARTQLRGYSGLMSFEPTFQTKQQVFGFCDRLTLFQIGVSWGGHESLAIPLQDPQNENKWFVRISVGQETVDDLMQELDEELRRA